MHSIETTVKYMCQNLPIQVSARRYIAQNSFETPLWGMSLEFVIFYFTKFHT